MNPRLAAARALAAVLNGKASLGSSLPPLLDRVEPRDRGLAQDLAFGTARWQPRLALLMDKLLQKPFKAADRDVEALLLVGLYQLLHTRIPPHAAIGETVACVDKLKKSSLKGLLNAVLRNTQRDHEALLAELDRDPVLHTAHPRWLQKRLKADWPEHWQAICAANNQHPRCCCGSTAARAVAKPIWPSYWLPALPPNPAYSAAMASACWKPAM